MTAAADIVVAAANSSRRAKARADLVCRGMADQTTIQDAIDSLRRNDGAPDTTGLTTGGGTVALLSGVYSMTAGVTVDKDLVELVGSGREATRLVAAPGFTGAALLRVDRVTHGRPAKACVVRNILLDGGGQQIDGLLWRGFGGAVADLSVYNVRGWGIHAHGYAPGEGLGKWGTYASKIVGAEVSTCGAGGVWFDAYAEDMWLVDGHLHECGGPGVCFNGSGTRVRNTMAWYCAPGFLVDGASRVHCVGCKLEQNSGGFYTTANGGSDLLYTAGSFVSNGRGAADTYDDVQLSDRAYFVSITNNQFSDAYHGQQARWAINPNGATQKLVIAPNQFDDYAPPGADGPWFRGLVNAPE